MLTCLLVENIEDNIKTPNNRKTGKSKEEEATLNFLITRTFMPQSTNSTNAAHINTQSMQGDSSKLVPDLSGATKPDGNNVDLDLQMGRLAQNSGDYANAARLIRRQIGLLRTAIRETR